MLIDNLDIRDIASHHNRGFDAHINIKTGTVIFIPNEGINPGVDIKAHFNKDLARIEKDRQDFGLISIPDSFEGFQIMKEYANAMTCATIQTKMNTILNSKKPFQNFNQYVIKVNEREKWFAFKVRFLMKRIEEEIEYLTSKY